MFFERPVKNREKTRKRKMSTEETRERDYKSEVCGRKWIKVRNGSLILYLFFKNGACICFYPVSPGSFFQVEIHFSERNSLRIFCMRGAQRPSQSGRLLNIKWDPWFAAYISLRAMILEHVIYWWRCFCSFGIWTDEWSVPRRSIKSVNSSTIENVQQ